MGKQKLKMKLMAAGLAGLLATTTALSLTGCGDQAQETVETTQEAEDTLAETAEAVTEEAEQESTEETAEESEEATEEVAEEEASDGNMIENGDFSQGVGNWLTFTTSGGDGTLSIDDQGRLETKIASMGTLEYGVQVYYDGFGLDNGCKYRLTFDASASEECIIQWRFQLNGGDYHSYADDYIKLTPETQTFDVTFTMEDNTDPAPRLCLNMGTMEDNPKKLAAHSVFVDNISLTLEDASGKTESSEEDKTVAINLNQVGYRTTDSKTAVFRAPSDQGSQIGTSFQVVEKDSGKEVYSGTIEGAKDNAASGELVAVGDFSEVTTPGEYKVVAEGLGESYSFTIADDVYQNIFKDTVRMFTLQRCGTELTKKIAGKYAHEACHTEKAQIYGTDQTIDVSGGWHDAGDYGRYVVAGAKAVMDLMMAYENAPDVFTDDMDIPESGNGISDVLDECRYELEWMLRMQDKKSGGVYHKVTCANFPGEVAPEEETDQLIVSPISTAATGDFAAVMAKAYRIYQKIDPSFATKCLEAAKKADKYLGKTDGGEGFTNPKGVVTGEYPDAIDLDERAFAAAELYLATNEEKYQKELEELNLDALNAEFGWADVGGYVMAEYLKDGKSDSAAYSKLKARMEAGVTERMGNMANEGYSCTLGSTYPWGSNMSVANNGMLLALAGQLGVSTDNGETDRVAKLQLDYLLGRNANSYCFVTGYGELSPENPHHRPSQVVGKAMKGMLIGGPDNALEDPYAQAVLKDAAPAKCYADNSQSYSCNEITIYWNSPLVYLFTEYVK